MSTPVSTAQRFTRVNPCPICGGHSNLPNGRGVRCYGFLSSDCRYAHCTREEHAHGLSQEVGGTYAHRLDGPCKCGEAHGAVSWVVNGRGPQRHSIQPSAHGHLTAPEERNMLRETTYEIRDGDGRVVAIHGRADSSDGDKRMWWERPGGAMGLGGLAPADLPPYGTHEWQPGRPTIHVEGEKARNALAPLAEALGYNLVGHVTGAPATHSTDALRPILSSQHFLWPDSDDVGETQMVRTQDNLRELMQQEWGIPLRQSKDAVRRIVWDGARAGEGDDAADFVAQGGTAEYLARLLSSAQPFHSAAPPVGVATERIFPFRSASEIATATSEEPPFIAAPWIAAGALTEIDGKIKSAGKTTFVTHMCRTILDGQDFLGNPTRRSPVVYLTEQSSATFREALRRADLLDRDDFRVLFWQDTIGAKWIDVVRAAREETARIGAQVLVVDTLAQFAGLRGDAENNAGAALEAVAPLQEAAAVDGLGVVILRHERKGGGDVGDSGRGSSAFAGAVDVVLRLRRPEGAVRPSVRVLDALSRFDQTPDSLVIELTDEGYVALGDSEAVAADEARTAILNAAPTSEAEALREDDLLSAADVKRTVGKGAICEHLEAGRLCRMGEGKKGDPYRYWRPPHYENVSAAATGVPAESNGHSDHVAEIRSATPRKGVPAESIAARSGDGFSPTRVESVSEPEQSDPVHSAGTASLSAAEKNYRPDASAEVKVGEFAVLDGQITPLLPGFPGVAEAQGRADADPEEIVEWTA